MIKNYLAIDFGTKRIGLAINKGFLAEPLKILLNDDRLLIEIKDICEQEKISRIIIGISEKDMATRTEKFVENLKQVIDLPITFMDETLSSKQVHDKLLQAGAKQKKRQSPIDHYAAALILQNWLDENF